MEKLIILADRGTFKAYKMDNSRTEGRPHIEQIESIEVVSGNRRIGEITTDQQGRHSDHRGGGPESKQQMSTGEAHGLEREEERRSISEIQKHIHRILQANPSMAWCLSAEDSINKMILSGIDSHAKDRLFQNLNLNLTNQPKDKIRNRFA